MASEISGYIQAIVADLQADYGASWNIRARGESPAVDNLAWQVVIGVAGGQPFRDGGGGLTGRVMFGATVLYDALGPDHNSSFQAADIAWTLMAWLANHIPDSHPIAEELEWEMSPVTTAQGGVVVNTGNYQAEVFWVVQLDISLDITIPGYTTGHPTRRVEYEDYGADVDDAVVTLEAS